MVLTSIIISLLHLWARTWDLIVVNAFRLTNVSKQHSGRRALFHTTKLYRRGRPGPLILWSSHAAAGRLQANGQRLPLS